MEKRIDQKKQRREEFIHRLHKTLAIVFCIALLVFFINITDMSTRRMIMCDDDKYAMTVSLQESNLLRFDLAGEKLVINVDPVIRVADYAISNSKRYFESIMKTVKAKLGK